MTEKKVFSGIGWLLAMYGWALFLPMFICNLYYGIWVGTQFVYFYKTWVLLLLAITIIILLMHLMFKKNNKEEELKDEK